MLALPADKVEESRDEVADTEAFSTELGRSGGRNHEKAVAILLDAEATSFLMMGSLSPGMKKHSVTLFEGGVSRTCHSPVFPTSTGEWQSNLAVLCTRHLACRICQQ
jgi:hypothetical protein